jgi:hypothetical protein
MGYELDPDKTRQVITDKKVEQEILQKLANGEKVIIYTGNYLFYTEWLKYNHLERCTQKEQVQIFDQTP